MKAGADPKMAELLVEKAKNQVNLDDLGKFTNMSTVVEGLKADYKEAFGSKRKGTPPAVPNPDKKKLDLYVMLKEEYTHECKRKYKYE